MRSYFWRNPSRVRFCKSPLFSPFCNSACFYPSADEGTDRFYLLSLVCYRSPGLRVSRLQRIFAPVVCVFCFFLIKCVAPSLPTTRRPLPKISNPFREFPTAGENRAAFLPRHGAFSIARLLSRVSYALEAATIKKQHF